MAIQGPALSEMTNNVLGAKPKVPIHVAVHKQTVINRDKVDKPTQPDIQPLESMVLNEGGVIGSIPANMGNYFHSSVDPIPFMSRDNTPSSKTSVTTLCELVAVMSDSIKSKAFYKVFVDLISPSNSDSISYKRFMEKYAGFIVYYSYTSNNNILDYNKFRTVLFDANGAIKEYVVAMGKPIYDNWMRQYGELLVKLNR